jgi:hypothetical protein
MQAGRRNYGEAQQHDKSLLKKRKIAYADSVIPRKVTGGSQLACGHRHASYACFSVILSLSKDLFRNTIREIPRLRFAPLGMTDEAACHPSEVEESLAFQQAPRGGSKVGR